MKKSNYYWFSVRSPNWNRYKSACSFPWISKTWFWNLYPRK